jgi:hypothetical protein
MDARQPLYLYEARGGEDTYGQAKRAYETALAETPDDPALLHDYGYLLECHGRRTLEAAAAAIRARDRARSRPREGAPSADPHRSRTRPPRRGDRAPPPTTRRAPRRRGRAPPARLRHVTARDFEAADRVLRADARLVELEGDVLAGTVHPDRSWERALQLDPENLSPR